MSIENSLQSLGLQLPAPPKAVGCYLPAVQVGQLIHTSGHLPMTDDGKIITGVLGADADVQAGYDAAQRAGLAILATVKDLIGSLDKVKKVVKLVGMVACTDDFDQQPAVINGCSELFRDVFGEAIGVGARSAVGMNALPLRTIVEIEAIFEVEE